MSRLRELRGLFLRNLTLKISSLVLATILWFHATTLRTYDEIQGVRFSLLGLADSLVILSPIPDRAEVAFRGKGDQLWWLFVRRPRIVIEGSGLHLGTTVLELSPRDVHVPVGLDVQVTEVVSPRTVRLEIDRMRRTTVPIVVETLGLPAPGFVRVTSLVEVDPAYVTLEGPASVIDDIDRVRTEPLDITNAKGVVSRRLRLILPEAPRLRANVEVVTAQVGFERLIHHTFEVPVGNDRPLREGWVLDPALVRLHLWAPSSMEDSLRALPGKGLAPEVRIPKVPRDSTTLEVFLAAPSWVRQWTAEPPRGLVRRAPA